MNTDMMIVLAVIVLGVMFGGEPDLMDGIIEYLSCKG